MDIFFTPYFFSRLTPTILTLLIAVYLLRKARRDIVAFYLGMFFAFMSLFNLGFLIAYAWDHVLAASGFYIAVFVIVAMAFKVQFAYHFPKKLFHKEARFVFIVSLVLALLVIVDYSIRASRAGYYFSLRSHLYASSYRSFYVHLYLLVGFIWVLVVQVRQLLAIKKGLGRTLRHTNSVRTFIVLNLTEFILNLLVMLFFVSSLVSSDVSNFILNVGLLFIWFLYVIIYANTAREKTSFMVKLVGISLVALLIITSLIGNRSLSRMDRAYDDKHLSITNLVLSNFEEGAGKKVPESIQYIIARPLTGGLFPGQYRILYGADDSVTLPGILEYETRAGNLLVRRKIQSLEMVVAGLSDEEVERKVRKGFLEKKIPLQKRGYRLIGNQRYIHYSSRMGHEIIEVGYSYMEYRKYLHGYSLEEIITLAFLLFLFFAVFPFFFNTNIVRPLNRLLAGIALVYKGDLNTKIVVEVEDEIGFLARSFNRAVTNIRLSREKLQEYTEDLEEKVDERTLELKNSNAELKKSHAELFQLKTQQDADYYLTSLLINPLGVSQFNSSYVNIQSLIKQKKEFEFIDKQWEIGGDFSLVDTLELNWSEYTFLLNADAMGKSLQGSGGVLVLGSILQAYLNRTKIEAKTRTIEPAEWLEAAFIELDTVFMSFDGSMMVSFFMALLENESGKLFHLNGEHPDVVLFRDNQARFLNTPFKLSKLGSVIKPHEVTVNEFMLLPGDTIIAGSDGRDDLFTRGADNEKIWNTDEDKILQTIMDCRANLEDIKAVLISQGEISDDLSLLSLEYIGEHLMGDKREPPSVDMELPSDRL